MSRSAITTLKSGYGLEAGDPVLFKCLVHQYNSCVRAIYNALVDKPDLTYSQAGKLIENFYKDNHLIDSYLLNAAYHDAKALYKRHNTSRSKSGLVPLGHKLIFGGKNLFARRTKHLISKEEFTERRLRPICVIGEANKCGNGRFKIRDFKCIDYVIKGKTVFTFKLHDRRLRILDDLKPLQDNAETPITYKINKSNICITFDKAKIKSELYNLKSNRHLSIDLNPENIGVTVFDDKDGHQELIASKVFDLSEILKRHRESKSSSDSEQSKFYNAKRKFELKEINKQIFELAKHYKAQYIDVENLHFKHLTGRKCTSQWNKTLTVQSLESRCNCSNINLMKINPAFTSIIGNIINDYSIPDMCRSALEIGNRSVTGIKLKSFNSEGIDYALHLDHFNEVKNFIIESTEERYNEELNSITDFKGISKFIRTHKIKYRKSIEDCRRFETSCNLKSGKSLVSVKTYKQLKGETLDSV